MSGQRWPLFNYDPVPGDPYAVAELKLHLGDVAASIRSQSELMKSLEAGDWESPAADAFFERQDELPPDLDAVAERYEKVMLQLAAWEEALGAIQKRINGPCENANEFQQELHETAITISELKAAGDEAGAEEAQSRCDALLEQINDERRLAESIVAEYEEIAQEVERNIREAIEDDLTNEWWQSALDTVGDWLGDASAWLGVLSLAFPPLAVAAIGANVISLGTRWGIEGEGPDQWGLLDWVGLGSAGLGRLAGGGKVAVRVGTSAGRSIRGVRRQLGELQPVKMPSMRRIVKKRGESQRHFEVRQRRLEARWARYREFDARHGELSARLENLERNRIDDLLGAVKKEQKEFWTQWRRGENWEPNLRDVWHPWQTDDPAWARRIGYVESISNILGTSADAANVADIDPEQIVRDTLGRTHPGPVRTPTPTPGPSPTPPHR